ncbi:MAG: GNAT family protein, partial [Candidatus Paceibacterota bacterium]
NKYQGWIPETIEDVEVFIGKISVEINEPETWFQFVIFEKESDKLIGDIGLHFMDSENKQVEIGCTLNKDYQGKGYAIEALKIILDFLINTLEKHRIVTSIDPENSNSIRLVERLGFRKEAHFVESLFLNGKWVDDIVFALLAREWK